VIDPACNLPGAIMEAAAVEQAVTVSNNVRVHKLAGHEASKAAVLAGLQDPEIDVFHFCGHGFYDGPEPEQSGLQCANGERLTGKDVAAFDAMPRVAFFNACRSARFRNLVPDPMPVSQGAGAPLALASPTYTRAFAAYFLRGGIEAYVGTLWPVNDKASAAFAASIYTELSRGATLDAAMCIARRALRETEQPDWANYILYGDGAFSIVH
jgi:CHAT domain-containing protein